VQRVHASADELDAGEIDIVDIAAGPETHGTLLSLGRMPSFASVLSEADSAYGSIVNGW
jgi:hypothetical protein